MRALAVLCMVTAGVRAEARQTFHATVDAVEVDVFVGRGVELTEGLTADDFLVYDNDELQTILTLQPSGLPVDAVLALDTSHSLRGEKLRDLKSAVRVTFRALEEEDGAALVTFSNDVSVARATKGGLEPLIASMEQAAAIGTTSLYDGIYVALKLADELENPFVVVFTDGEDRFSWLNGDQVLRSAMRSETPVFTVVTPSELAGRPGHIAFLSRLADTTGGEHYVARTTRELGEIFARALARMRNRYVLTYSPTSRQPGWHSIRVRLRSGGADVRARRGYYREDLP